MTFFPRRGLTKLIGPGLFSLVLATPASAHVKWFAPYIVDARYDPSLRGGLPQGGETLVQFPNSHLGYAITWFGLALALLGVYIALLRRKLRGGPEKNPS